MANDVTIKIDCVAHVLAYLHHPGSNSPPTFLVNNTDNDFYGLPNGTYYVSLSGSGLPADSPVDVTFTAAHNERVHPSSTLPNHTISDFIDFFLQNGTVE